MSDKSRVLISGAAGFLGKHLVEGLASKFQVRALDRALCEGAAEAVIASVTDAKAIGEAVSGVDALVIAHMAPNTPGTYDEMSTPLDVNVKGAAMLLEAASLAGVRKVVLISSTGVVGQARLGAALLDGREPFDPDGIYGLTKCLQEEVVRFFQRRHKMSAVIFRPAYIIREDSLTDKYGRKPPSVNWLFIDPRDIAAACAKALKGSYSDLEIFPLVGGPGAEEHADFERARVILDWSPRHRFLEWPRDCPAD